MDLMDCIRQGQYEEARHYAEIEVPRILEQMGRSKTKEIVHVADIMCASGLAFTAHTLQEMGYSITITVGADWSIYLTVIGG